MTKRALAIAAIAAGVLTFGGGVAAGCGDKFVMIGGGSRVNRSKFPSRVLVFMNPGSRIPAAEKEFHVEATLTAAGHKAKVVESEAEVQKALDSGSYDIVLADSADLPLLYKPTAAELSAAEKEANCLVRPSRKSSDLLAVIDETMRDRQKGVAPNCPPPR